MKELIERIKAHVVDKEGCWEWRGAIHQKVNPVPVMSWKGSTNKVRRFLAIELGVAFEGGVATCKCGNPLCVKPAHIEVITRSELQRRLSARMLHQLQTARRAKISEAKRAKAKLTAEMVQEIRTSTESQAALARRFGVSQATVSEIRRGLTWRDYTNPFSQLLERVTK